ncbi:Ig-like domain-containing protein, partial [Aliivibrio fischeri]
MYKIIYSFMAMLLTSLILTGCNFEDPFKRIKNTTDKELVSIQVTPTIVKTKGVSNLTVVVGLTQSFMAIGTYTDGTSEDISHSVIWKSSNVVIATMKGKVLRGLSEGATQVSVSQGGISSNALDITVISAALKSIQVTPA